MGLNANTSLMDNLYSFQTYKNIYSIVKRAVLFVDKAVVFNSFGFFLYP